MLVHELIEKLQNLDRPHLEILIFDQTDDYTVGIEDVVIEGSEETAFCCYIIEKK